MQGEIAEQIRKHPIRLEPLSKGRTYRLYASPHNLGAAAVAVELQEVVEGLCWTDDAQHLGLCDRMLVHLHDRTWNGDEESATAFAAEVATAMRLGVRMLLLHEVLSGRDDDNLRRHACTFGWLIESTPKHLVAAKFYETMIALNLAGDEWRQTGLIRAAQRIAEASGVREPREVAEAEEKRAEVHSRAVAAARRAAVASGTARALSLAGGAEKSRPRWRSFAQSMGLVHPAEDDQEAVPHSVASQRPKRRSFAAAAMDWVHTAKVEQEVMSDSITTDESTRKAAAGVGDDHGQPMLGSLVTRHAAGIGREKIYRDNGSKLDDSKADAGERRDSSSAAEDTLVIEDIVNDSRAVDELISSTSFSKVSP